MLIRRAEQSDVDGLADLLHTITELESVVGKNIRQTREGVRQQLSLALDSPDSVILVGLNPEGEVAGYASVHWVPFLFFAGPEAYISELFVRPEARGTSLGTSLLREIETLARQRGCTRLSLLNGRDGEAYRRQFYAKRGWVERDRMANFVLPLAGGTDKPLEPTPAPVTAVTEAPLSPAADVAHPDL